jgi:hypothetical protein
MYEDKLIMVDKNRLIQNKKYYIFRNRDPNNQYHACDVFTGFYINTNKTKFYHSGSENEDGYDSDSNSSQRNVSESESSDSSDEELITYIGFKKLRNMVSLKKIKSAWYFDSTKIMCYEFKEPKQHAMENKYFKIVLRKLLGETFSHYLFEDIKFDYELLTDNLVSNNTDYEIHEIIDSKYNYSKYIWYIINYIINIIKYVHQKQLD